MLRRTTAQACAARIRQAVHEETSGVANRFVSLVDIRSKLGLSDDVAQAAVRYGADEGWLSTAGGRVTQSVALTLQGRRCARRKPVDEGEGAQLTEPAPVNAASESVGQVREVTASRGDAPIPNVTKSVAAAREDDPSLEAPPAKPVAPLLRRVPTVDTLGIRIRQAPGRPPGKR